MALPASKLDFLTLKSGVFVAAAVAVAFRIGEV